MGVLASRCIGSGSLLSTSGPIPVTSGSIDVGWLLLPDLGVVGEKKEGKAELSLTGVTCQNWGGALSPLC